MTLLKALETLIKYSEIQKDMLPQSQALKDLTEAINQVEYALLPIGTDAKEVAIRKV